MNLLASHPDLCTVGELHQVFKGSSHRDSKWKIAVKALTRDLPVIVASGEDFFSPRNLRPRRPAAPGLQRFIRQVLDRAKQESRHEHLNRYKAPGVEYLPQEIARGRLLAKLLDGGVHLFEVLTELYPQASFVGLTRDGLAVCEGHMRRGRTARDAGRLYRLVATTMLRQASEWPRYHLVKFEDLLAHPLQRLGELYRLLGLDPQRVGMLRLQDRRLLDASGRHQLRGRQEWRVHWHPPHELPSVLDPQVNHRQVQRLAASDRRLFLCEAAEAMQQLGYGQHQPSEIPLARAA